MLYYSAATCLMALMLSVLVVYFYKAKKNIIASFMVVGILILIVNSVFFFTKCYLTDDKEQCTSLSFLEWRPKMSLNYAGTSTSVNLLGQRNNSGPDLAYGFSESEKADEDYKKSFLDAMEKFTNTEEFEKLTKSLHSEVKLEVTLLVHTKL